MHVGSVDRGAGEGAGRRSGASSGMPRPTKSVDVEQLHAPRAQVSWPSGDPPTTHLSTRRYQGPGFARLGAGEDGAAAAGGGGRAWVFRQKSHPSACV
jgi:hypothetical protein